MWKRLDVDPNTAYRVALVQARDGRRGYALVPDGTEPPADTVFLTEVVPYELLLGRIGELAKTVPLVGGGRFVVDAHNLWFTPEEILALFEGREVPWLNGLCPDFAPK